MEKCIFRSKIKIRKPLHKYKNSLIYIHRLITKLVHQLQPEINVCMYVCMYYCCVASAILLWPGRRLEYLLSRSRLNSSSLPRLWKTVCMYVCKYVSIYVCMYVCMYVLIYLYDNACAHNMCVCMFVCMYCLYACIY